MFNNKGNPVKQYEPFFSATSDFEDEASLVATGVTPIIHYDPLDRVIRTELPKGTESRVEFDAWQQTAFDPNDTVLTSTWYSDRGSPPASGAEPGGPEQRAAWLAAQHADTPTRTHLDSLGRPFLVVAHNRAAGVDAFYETRSKLDIEGNVLRITDARGNATIEQRYDVLSRRILVESADAGNRLLLTDSGGSPLRGWDSRTHTLRFGYDSLRRPTRSYVALGAGTERLVLRAVYGEGVTPLAAAQQANLRGRLRDSYDCAGFVRNVQFDLKGNLRESSRRLAVAYQTEPDWLASDAVTGPSPDPDAVLVTVTALLEPAGSAYDSATAYDALNRVTSHTTPDGTVTVPTYNEANLLEQLRVGVKGAAPQLAIANIDYNARGQRILCQYADPILSTDTTPVVTSSSEYTYDRETFRLTRIHTTRGGTNLQDLLYTYDPVGNIVELRNAADSAPFFNSAPDTGDGKYVYDAIYRLVSATGREHPGTQPVSIDPLPGTALPHPNDIQALTRYAETYAYDSVGNITQIAHTAGSSGSGGWTRNYQYASANNRLLFTSVPGSPSALTEAYTYDAHGSMLSIPHLPGGITWDYADRMKSADKGGGGIVYFTYDGAGQRVRKVWEHAGVVEERIYLGGYEIYRKHTATLTGAIELERETVHVMDDQRRVALAETKTIDTVSGGTGTTRWRFQLDNHLGSAMIELDQTGGVISYEEYHPYGSTAFSAAKSGVEVSAKRYRYTGKERDEETGLYYHGARYYAPWLARWTASDPLGLTSTNDAGWSSYAYVRQNPINRVDRDGLQDTAPDSTSRTQQAPLAPGRSRPPKPAARASAPPARSVGLLQRLREFVSPPKLGPTPEEPIKEPERTYTLQFKQEATAEREIDSKLNAKQRGFVVQYFQVALEEVTKRGLAPEAALLLTAHASIETGYGQAGPNVKGNNFLSLQPPRALQEELEKREIKVPLERRQNRNAKGELVSQLTPSPQFKDIRQSIQVQLDLVYGLKLPEGGELKALFPTLGRELKDTNATPESYGRAAARAGYAGAGTPEAERYTSSLVQAHELPPADRATILATRG